MAPYDLPFKDDPTLVVQNFNKQLDGQFPNLRSYHTKVTVLCLYWEEDDMGVETEVNGIGELFKMSFGYEIERFMIPSKNSQIVLTRKVMEIFEEHMERASLLIIYYGGHGLPDNGTDGRYGSVWAAYGSPTILYCLSTK